MSHNVQCRTGGGEWVNMGNLSYGEAAQRFVHDAGLSHGEQMEVEARWDETPDVVFRFLVVAEMKYAISGLRGDADSWEKR